MAKGNHTSVYGTKTGQVPNWSGWMVQQEQLNMQQDRWNKQLLDDAKKAKADKDAALAKELESLQYGKTPEFTPTGIEALDYQRRKIGLAALDENWKLEEEIRKAYANGEMTPFKLAELKQKKSQLLKLPENLAVVEQTFKGQVEEFTKSLSEGKVFMTDENKQRLRRLQNGDYDIVLDPDNYGEFMIVFDKDDDGQLDYIPMSDFMQGKSLGAIVPNINMMDSGLAFGKTLGTSLVKDNAPNGYYTITEKGLKYNDDELINLAMNLGSTNPAQANSFAYQMTGGKLWKDLSNDEQLAIATQFAEYMKLGIDEEYKKEFDSGRASNALGHRNAAENEWYHRQLLAQKQREFNFQYEKWQKENPTSNVLYAGNVPITTVNKDGEEVTTKQNAPAYATNGLKITTTNRAKGKNEITVKSIVAYPVNDGSGIKVIASDGTQEYELSKADALAVYKDLGITENMVIQDYLEANNYRAITYKGKVVKNGDSPNSSSVNGSVQSGGSDGSTRVKASAQTRSYFKKDEN